jgi:ABC-2 type transport system ATP-binding protein
VAIIAAGRIVAEGRPDELGGREARPAEIRFRLPAGVAASEVPPGLEAKPAADGELLISSVTPIAPLNELTGWALERSIELDGLEVTRPSLEDIYLELTGADAAEAAAAATAAENGAP